LRKTSDYDSIIVGAGLACRVIAGHSSQDARVALVEARGTDNANEIHVPRQELNS
jgi:hypothetical protein